VIVQQFRHISLHVGAGLFGAEAAGERLSHLLKEGGVSFANIENLQNVPAVTELERLRDDVEG
jgi:hypothetical protein